MQILLKNQLRKLFYSIVREAVPNPGGIWIKWAGSETSSPKKEKANRLDTLLDFVNFKTFVGGKEFSVLTSNYLIS